ncbi:hypothetical protein B0A52_03954 [Exophiala mesophila]|uniref:Uncharacterized protein n=1 Tax=Exophiala mesophila TaxID=212818 RepID=A0A438N7N6_EXOME|nr:hypothetical protein B0A52_03954 [Exophiala mesophila]
MAELNPFLLAATIPDPDARLLPLLRSRPELASAQDEHGYSLLHAAASYNHLDLLRALVGDFHVDINLKDEDGETCLFVAETAEMVRLLVEELNIDTNIQNDEAQTAAEKFEAEAEFPDVVTYFRTRSAPSSLTNGMNSNSVGGLQHPPPLPPNVSININTASDPTQELSQEPDPEFRRRIEELAARENFNTEEGQRELRDLITDAVRGVGNDARDVRRRID